MVVAFALEIFSPEVCWHLFQVLVGRPTLARMGQRILIDVGRVNLRPLAVLGGSEHLGEQHRNAVRFLAGRDPSTPHPDRLVRGFAIDDLGQDLRSQIVPGFGIAKVTGDVDQDGVEEGAEFVGIRLQVVEVRPVIIDVDVRHALRDPAKERGSLVAAEIEAACLSQILQQTLEIGALRLVGHVANSFITRVTRAGAISSSGRMKSALPDLIAAPGMPLNSAEAWSWATTVPPIFLIAPIPIDPSLPVPVSTTAIALCL